MSKIRVKSQESLAFPIITLCDPSIFTTREAERLIDDSLSKMNYSLEKENKTLEEARYDMNLIIDLLMGRAVASNLNETTKKSWGFPLNDLIQACKFDG